MTTVLFPPSQVRCRNVCDSMLVNGLEALTAPIFERGVNFRVKLRLQWEATSEQDS